MNSFLQLLAKDLIQKHGNKFDNLTILFPNKRAGLFLAEELAHLISLQNIPGIFRNHGAI